MERKIQFVSEIDYMMDNKSQARKTDIFQSIDQANVSIGRKTTCLPFTRVSPITFTWKSLAKDDLKFPSSTNFSSLFENKISRLTKLNEAHVINRPQLRES